MMTRATALIRWTVAVYQAEMFLLLNTTGCHYNGKVYNQNDTWTDGCSYDCTCVDYSNGQYQCTKRCPEWTLPTVCSWLDPQPGKCCKQPTCPYPYKIGGYPDV